MKKIFTLSLFLCAQLNAMDGELYLIGEVKNFSLSDEQQLSGERRLSDKEYKEIKSDFKKKREGSLDIEPFIVLREFMRRERSKNFTDFTEDFLNHLLNKEIDFKRKNNDGNTIIYKAVTHPYVLRKILKYKKNQIDINHKNNYGETILHYAIRKECYDVITMIVGFGINVSIKDCDGYTAGQKILQKITISDQRKIELAQCIKMYQNK